MVEKIGKVLMNFDYYKGQDLYSDGDVEETILDIVKNENDYKYTDKRFCQWPILYHLSRQRENIVDPMSIKDTDCVLEIGAGMGAVSGALAARAKNLKCIELSKRRSLVNAYRHKEFDNIEIMVGNFQDIVINEKYDVVTLIGVLEYAGYYIDSEIPDEAFLNKIRSYIAPGGRLYIAIENRLGMKYFSGYHEDHLSVPFVGIEGYIGQKVKTYSYSELVRLLRKCGFSNIEFAFPFPDYKLPQIILDESTLIKDGVDITGRHNYDATVTQTFDCYKAINSMRGCEEIKYFANSFLVEATL